ncbi:hypothetical protein FQA47_008463 [Oryzias melastigma]|uniref:Uncharacterized protein n=1 Tax=Oryzias melastigma TaxID=30732 RepID=A0A834CJX5_ORYME|nr:hypothetical protein FQA47_008463 [Oryzias melastigma]
MALTLDMSAKKGLKISIQSVSIRFDYYRSVEFCSKRRRTERCTSKLSKRSKQMTPGGRLPEDGVISHRKSVAQKAAAERPGPLFHHHDTAQKPKPVHNLCPACHKLYQTVKRHRAPIKDKLLDNDPSSLTCDQWVLIKKWLPRKLSHSSRLSRGDARFIPLRREQRVGAGEPMTCSRPHIFLQRNLRQCTRLLAEKKRKTKTRKQRKAGSQTFVAP